MSLILELVWAWLIQSCFCYCSLHEIIWNEMDKQDLDTIAGVVQTTFGSTLPRTNSDLRPLKTSSVRVDASMDRVVKWYNSILFGRLDNETNWYRRFAGIRDSVVEVGSLNNKRVVVISKTTETLSITITCVEDQDATEIVFVVHKFREFAER